MKIDLNAMTRRFVSGETLKEGKSPDITSYIQTLGEILQNIRPKSMSERRRLEVARHQLKEIRKVLLPEKKRFLAALYYILEKLQEEDLIKILTRANKLSDEKKKINIK